MNFASDNTTGASPEIIDAIVRSNDGQTMPYGDDEYTRRVRERICEIFEADADVYLVATGTAANALSLSVLLDSYGATLCHWESHVYEDECGAPEFFSGGGKLIPVDGANGKMSADALLRHARRGVGDVHMVQPQAVSLTQETEVGSIYSLAEIEAVSDLCRANKLKLHMDGARFANALVALGCSPAEMTWKAGVDVLSFGASKNGAMASEAVVLFDKNLSREFEFRRKRAGHLFSKMRLLACQMEAYLKDDLWLTNARHANAMAQRLADGLTRINGISLTEPVDGNMLFPRFPDSLTQALYGQGAQFYSDRWQPGIVRLVTAFNTPEADVEAFIDAVRRHMASQPSA